ncbi:MAG: sensor histidine kinase [Candidatus Omnitrophica bacterium]|nr:sensor histidine kinase [Candidatus Omnitrophota bacterium]MDD5429353.1 sensor histidine kinase [Candidatus Omnitrophota bacterium]
MKKPKKNRKPSLAFSSKSAMRQVFESNQQKGAREFYRKVLIMQEEEKKRISRDLHDETGQIVVGLGTALGVIEQALEEGDAAKALGIIKANKNLIKEIALRMKAMALNLRPPALDILGLSAVLRDYFSKCTHTGPVKVEFNENVKDVKLSEDLEITVYRIVQEAITNIFKHAHCNKVKVELFLNQKNLELVMEDNGKGFDIDDYKKQNNFAKLGLRGIQERVDILGGKFFVKSSPGKGTRLSVVFPLEK